MNNIAKADARFHAYNTVKADYEIHNRPDATLSNPEFKASVDAEMERILKDPNFKLVKPAHIQEAPKKIQVDSDGFAWVPYRDQSADRNAPLGYDYCKSSAISYICGTDATDGLPYVFVVQEALATRKEITFAQLLTELACEYGRADTEIAPLIKDTLRYMEWEGDVKNEYDVSTEAMRVNPDYYNGWRIINLKYKAPITDATATTGKYVIADPKNDTEYMTWAFNTPDAKTDLLDFKTEVEVATWMKHATLAQRSRLFIRAVENARKRV